MGKNVFFFYCFIPLWECHSLCFFLACNFSVSLFSSFTDSIYKSEHTNLMHRNVKDLHSISARISSFIIELGLIRVTKPKEQHRLPSSKRRFSQIQSFHPREHFMMMELLHICALQPNSYSMWLLSTCNVVCGWPITQHSFRDLQVNEKLFSRWVMKGQVLWEVWAGVLGLLGNWLSVLGLSRV